MMGFLKAVIGLVSFAMAWAIGLIVFGAVMRLNWEMFMLGWGVL